MIIAVIPGVVAPEATGPLGARSANDNATTTARLRPQQNRPATGTQTLQEQRRAIARLELQLALTGHRHPEPEARRLFAQGVTL